MLTRSFMTPESSKDLLAYTPMLHARMFIETVKFRDHHFQPTRSSLTTPANKKPDGFSSDLYLDGHPKIDRPLFVQFCANSPDELLEAARYVEPYCDAVDLNLGCPQGIARRGNYGAFLQEDWNLIYKLINKLHLNLDVPVTAKMRILESKEKTLQYAQMILSAGASVITVHGRQRDQKGHKTGLADWSALRYLRANLPPDTVIFANGNILRHGDIQTIFAKPPDAESDNREYWRGRDGKGGYRMDAVFRRYIDILYEHVLEKPSPVRKPLFLPSDPLTQDTSVISSEVPEEEDERPAKKRKRDHKDLKPTSPNLLAIQPHLFHLLRPLVTKHHNVRDALGRSRAGDMAAYENILQMVEAAVKDGLLDYDADPDKYEESDLPDEIEQQANLDKEESTVATVKACKRPWWVCQPYVRPLLKEALAKGSLTMSKKDKRKLEEENILGKAKLEQGGKSEREKLDMGDGMHEEEMPKEAMVAG